MFELQLNSPKILSINEEESMNLEDAIESAFPLKTENLVLIWNNISIPLTYKYDVSIMIFDFMRIISFLKEDDATRLEIHWASNTFATIWEINKKNNSVYIKTKWSNVIGGQIELLNNKNENILKINEFQNEIKKLLCFIKISIEKSSRNHKLIEDFEKLEICCR
jgi:hypothetical protein